MRIRRVVWIGSTLLCLTLATLAGGCGGEFTVTGKVKVRGQALNGGLVTFISTRDESQKRSASIGADGTYTMYNPPRGEVVVTVKVEVPQGLPAEEEPPEPREVPGMKLPGKGQRPPEIVRINPQYADPTSSGIRKEVKHSGQKINIDLEE